MWRVSVLFLFKIILIHNKLFYSKMNDKKSFKKQHNYSAEVG